VGGHNGTISGNVAYGAGEVGSAFQLDGASFIAVPATADLTPQAGITVDAWVNLSPSGLFSPIVKNSGTATSVNAGYSLEFGGTSAGFWVFVAGNWYYGGLVEIPLGTWTNLVGTYDGSSVTLYVNGVQAGIVSGASGPIEPGTLGLNIGHDPSAAEGDRDRFLTGEIDEASIFSRALTPSEIQAIYVAGAAGMCAVPPPATTQIQNLISSTLITNLASNIQNQLDAKLSSALATLDAAQKNSSSTAANQLQAFVNSVAADVKAAKLTCAQGTTLVGAAQQIVAALGRPPLSVTSCQ
jgi:hypothetical protein